MKAEFFSLARKFTTIKESVMAEDRKVTNTEIVRYSMYSLASFLVATAMGSFLNIFITEKLLVGAAVMGTVLLIGRVVDLLVCTVSGAIIQGSNMKWGKYRSWIIILKYVIFAGYFFLFFNSSSLPFFVKMLFILTGYLAINVSLNFVATSSFGILANICGPSLENRNKLSIWSTRFMVVGQLIAASSALPAVNFLAPRVGDTNAYTIVMVAVGFVMFLGMKSLSDVAKPYDLPQDAAGPAAPKVSLLDMAKAVVTNDQLLVYVGAQLLSITAVFGITGTLSAYYYMYILGDFNLLTLVMTANTLIGLLAIFIAPRIGTKLGKKRAMTAGLLGAGIGGLLIFLFGDRSVYLYIGLASIGVFCTYFYAGFGVNYIIDCGEYGFWKSGQDNRTVTMSMFNVPMKVATLLGGTVGAFALAFIGYTPGFDPATVPGFTRNFMFMFGGVPGILNLIGSLVFGLGYKITDADAAKYAKENMERVTAAASAN
jgi:GPH family glycoside/pentoside/hexuronide:cation symporter